MTCFHPRTIWIKNSKPIDFPKWTEDRQHSHNKPKMTLPHDDWNYIEMQVPCNTCLGCKLDHASMWGTRCAIEAKQWENCCFVTLTYNNEHYNGGLHKKDLQDFLKRLRYHEEGIQWWENINTSKTEKPIRYFACGEYGTHNTKRGHFHLAIFNWKPDDLKFYKQNKHGDFLYKSKKLMDIWGKGFVVIGDLTYKSANYIARYTMKKAGLNPKPRLWRWGKDHKRKFYKPKTKREPEFIVMSRGVGIGRTWWEENKEFCKKWGHINLCIDGKVEHKPLPRYFKKLWEAEDWETYEIYKFEQIKIGLEKYQETLEKHEIKAINDETKMHKLLIMQEETLIAKSQALKRTNFI